MSEPTQGQIKEFWEWCKVRNYVWVGNGQTDRLVKPSYPPIDLNNLFKYAVPFLLDKHTIIETYSFKQESGLYYSETTIWDRDERQLKGKLVGKAFIQDLNLEKANTLALFWALWQVKEK